MGEGMRAAGEVDPPDAQPTFAGKLRELGQLRLERVRPEAEGAGVVAPQRFRIGDLQAGARDVRDRPGDMGQLAVGEHISGDEVPGTQADVATVGIGGGDAVLQGQAARLEQAVDDLEVGRQVLQADMLEHADRADPVVDLGSGDVAVVGQPDLDPILQARLPDPLAGELELVLRQGHAEHPGAMVLRRVDRQGAPAAADVEQAHARAQPQLATHMLELGLLGLRQGFVASREIGAGIDHRRIEPARIEVVGDVVVILDRLAVRTAGVLRDPVGQAAEPAVLVGIVGQGGRHVDDVLDVTFDVELALDEGGAEGIEAGIDQTPGRRHVAQRDGDHRIIAQVDRGSVPEPDGKRDRTTFAQLPEVSGKLLLKQETPPCGRLESIPDRGAAHRGPRPPFPS